jgi:hypothetical protein
MHPDTRKISDHMKEFGLTLFGRAISDSTFSEMTAPYNHAVALTVAAQAAEILIKARIAQEHPLLIFKKFPSSASTPDALSVTELFDQGQSHTYESLPEILWASTGLRLRELHLFREFGKLRNTIVHFAVPNVDLGATTLEFCTACLFPFILESWPGSQPLEYGAEWYEDLISGGYLEYALMNHEIPIGEELRQALGPESEAEARREFDISREFRKS